MDQASATKQAPDTKKTRKGRPNFEQTDYGRYVLGLAAEASLARTSTGRPLSQRQRVIYVGLGLDRRWEIRPVTRHPPKGAGADRTRVYFRIETTGHNWAPDVPKVLAAGVQQRLRERQSTATHASVLIRRADYVVELDRFVGLALAEHPDTPAASISSPLLELLTAGLIELGQPASDRDLARVWAAFRHYVRSLASPTRRLQTYESAGLVTAAIAALPTPADTLGLAAAYERVGVPVPEDLAPRPLTDRDVAILAAREQLQRAA
jgi:hypothetical protein